MCGRAWKNGHCLISGAGNRTAASGVAWRSAPAAWVVAVALSDAPGLVFVERSRLTLAG